MVTQNISNYCKTIQVHPNIPDNCLKCNSKIGTLFHCMWECEKIKKVWEETLYITSSIIDSDVPVDAKSCILHIFPKDLLNIKKKMIFHFCLLQTQHVIVSKWNDSQLPTSGQWSTYLAKGKK